MVETEVISFHKPGRINELSSLDRWVDVGVEFLYSKDGEYVPYPEKKEQTTTIESDPIEVSEEKEYDNPYEELFDAHWKVQVNNVREYTDEIPELMSIIEYAEENDISDGVIKRLNEYLEELKE